MTLGVLLTLAHLQTLPRLLLLTLLLLLLHLGQHIDRSQFPL